MTTSIGLRFCTEPGCSIRVPRGRCHQHARTSAHRRGYDAHWERFRTVTYPTLLLEQGIYIPTCGARLQPGPHPYSECAKAGIGTFTDLELDHDPPLKQWERAHPRIVCDPARIGGYLCKTCHAKKTRHERNPLRGERWGERDGRGACCWHLPRGTRVEQPGSAQNRKPRASDT